MAEPISFSNLLKPILAAKIASADWFAQNAVRSFDDEHNDLVDNYSWPTPKSESWKYTNISNLARLEFWPSENFTPENLPVEWQDFLKDGFHSSFVFSNGRYCKRLSQNSKSDQFTFSISAPSTQLPSAPTEFEKINELLSAERVQFEVNKNQTLVKPVVFLFLNSAEVDRPQIGSTRLELIMNENSQAVVLEIHAGRSEFLNQIDNHVSASDLKKSSHLQHYFLNVTANGSSNFFIKKYEQAANSILKSIHFDLGGKLSRTETFVNLNDSHAEATVNGLYITNQKQHCDHQGVIYHRAPETSSHQLFKGILADQSRGVFNAKIRIEQTAPKSSAQQLNKNLLLSSRAEIDSLPRLEIFNDDVKATHGSASGQLDADQIFYLVSRAISRENAVQLLMEAFALEMLSDVADDVAQKLEPLVSKKLDFLTTSFMTESKK